MRIVLVLLFVGCDNREATQAPVPPRQAERADAALEIKRPYPIGEIELIAGIRSRAEDMFKIGVVVVLESGPVELRVQYRLNERDSGVVANVEFAERVCRKLAQWVVDILIESGVNPREAKLRVAVQVAEPTGRKTPTGADELRQSLWAVYDPRRDRIDWRPLL